MRTSRRRKWVTIALTFVAVAMALPSVAEDLDPVTGLCVENEGFNESDENSSRYLICPLLPKADDLIATGIGPDTIGLNWNDNSIIETGYEIQVTNDPTNGPWVRVKNGKDEYWPACEADNAAWTVLDCAALITRPPVNAAAPTPQVVPADPTVHWYRVRPVFPGRKRFDISPGVSPEIPDGPLTAILHGPWSDPDPSFLGPLPPLNLAVTLSATNPPFATITWQNQATGDPTFCDNQLFRAIDVPDFGAPLQEGLGNATTTIDTGLQFNKTYFYTVRAVRCQIIPLTNDPEHLEEAYSNGIPASGSVTGGGGIIVITPPPPPPGAPAGLSILPTCPDRAQLLWSDTSTNEHGFLIEWGPTPTQFNQQTAIGTRGGTGFVTFLHLGIPADTTRYYQVKSYRVVDVNGVQTAQISVPTNVASVTLAPKAPTNLRATSSLAAAVTLSWTDNSKTETGYRVERCTIPSGQTTCSSFAVVGSTGPVGTNSSGGTGTFTDISVSGSTRYLYRVYAFNASCDSGTPSNLLDLTTPPAPLIPPVLQVTVGHAHWIQLIWSDLNAATVFRVEFRDPGRPWVILKDNLAAFTTACPAGLTGTCFKYDDFSIPGMTSRCYRVRAKKGGQISDPSNEACGTTPAGPKPPAPSNLTGAPWGPCPVTNPPSCDPTHAVELHWTDNSEGSLEEDGFIVEHSRDNTTWKEIVRTARDVTVLRYGNFEPHSIQFFRVKAYNFEGQSGYSNPVQVQLLGPSRPIWLNPPKNDTVAPSSCYVDGKYVLGEGTNDIAITVVRKIAAESNSYRCTTAPGSCKFDPPSATCVPNQTNGCVLDAPNVNQVQLDWNGPGTFRLDFFFRKNVTYELHAEAINGDGASADAPIWTFVVLADCPLGTQPQ